MCMFTAERKMGEQHLDLKMNIKNNSMLSSPLSSVFKIATWQTQSLFLVSHIQKGYKKRVKYFTQQG